MNYFVGNYGFSVVVQHRRTNGTCLLVRVHVSIVGCQFVAKQNWILFRYAQNEIRFVCLAAADEIIIFFCVVCSVLFFVTDIEYFDHAAS